MGSQEQEHLVLSVDSSLFPEPVLVKALYWMGDRFSVTMERRPDSAAIDVTFRAVGHLPDWSAVEARFRRDLIDFRTRQLVADETRSIRELIAAKAFAAMDPLPLPPPGTASDPVGFDVAEFERGEE